MDQSTVEQLTLLVAVLAAITALYGKAFGPYQVQLVQWAIDAFRVTSRWRGLLNLAIGVLFAMAVSVIAAGKLGNWWIVPIGALAGVMASIEAAKVHDQAKESSERPPPA